MRNIKAKLTGICLLIFSLYNNTGIANDVSVHLEQAPVNLSDYASLQRGAKYFMNFCAGCHSAEYIRYSRLSKDIKLTDSDSVDGEVLTDLVKANLMFNTADINSQIKSGLEKKDAQKMFGVAPPDLTMITRVRGQDWVYTYLKTFYKDSKRPWGVNNLVFKDAAMPHVLLNYQGEQRLNSNGELELVSPGLYTPEQYDQMITDLTGFLAYTAEPYKAERTSLGVWVLLFLSLFLVFAYLLKREYWKDVKNKH